MIKLGLTVRWNFDPTLLLREVKEATYRNLGHWAASVRKLARQSMRPSRRPSRRGRPPHTRGKRRNLPNAILYAVEPDGSRAVVGPAYSRIKTVGKAHEKGGWFRGRKYPKRPFMGPALMKSLPRVPLFWRDSIR